MKLIQDITIEKLRTHLYHGRMQLVFCHSSRSRPSGESILIDPLHGQPEAMGTKGQRSIVPTIPWWEKSLYLQY